MKYQCAMHTDVGLRKNINQDSMCILEAEYNAGTVLLAVVCDGMGGLRKGELASATIIKAFTEWFDKELPEQLAYPEYMDEIRYRWERLIKEYNQRIQAYGKSRHLELGSTLTVMFFCSDGKYIIGQVGDSRAYRITASETTILTEDQTVTAREVKMGRLSQEEGEKDPRSHILLQCIGASKTVIPEFSFGECVAGECYMLCSDGFRHVVTKEEIGVAFSPEICTDEEIMQQKIKELVELNKQRNETDNISAMLIKLL